MTFFKTVCALALVALLPMFLRAVEVDKEKSSDVGEKGTNAVSEEAKAPADSGVER